MTTKYEWNDRSDLWSKAKPSKYEDAPDFDTLTGMSRDRFNDLWKNMRLSSQLDTRPDDMSSEKYRWMLVDDSIEAFNQHRSAFFYVSDQLCVDESFSRWYGQGGAWINMGLP